MRYWFVNLGKYYKEQRKGSFLWAPLYNKYGKKVYHWETMKMVNKGDVIFCNNDAKIVSVGVAQGGSYLSEIPDSFNNTWKPKGRKLNVKFIDLNIPFKFNDYRDYILSNINNDENPFDIRGKAKQGYLFKFDENIAKYFVKKINNSELNEMIDYIHDMDEELEIVSEESEQFRQINNGDVTGYSDEEVDNREKEEYNYEDDNNKASKKSTREKTDPKLKATRLERAGFLCEVDNNHTTFLNSSGISQYMECHHIIPMKAQRYFKKLRLDSMFNLISVCPMCHAKVHYANDIDKKDIFMKMYKMRENEMIKKGFDLEKINYNI